MIRESYIERIRAHQQGEIDQGSLMDNRTCKRLLHPHAHLLFLYFGRMMVIFLMCIQLVNTICTSGDEVQGWKNIDIQAFEVI